MNEYYEVRAGQGIKVASSVFDKLPPATPISRLFDALNKMQQVGNRLSDVADRLVGSTPTDEAGNSGLVAGGGVLNEVERAAADFEGLIEAMNNHLLRIERRL